MDAKDALFKRLYGVKPDAFHKMPSILQKEFDASHKNAGEPPKLTAEDKLYIAKILAGVRMMDGDGAECGRCEGSVRLPLRPGKKRLKKIKLNPARHGGRCRKPAKKVKKSVVREKSAVRRRRG
jgi:hypothetical protein